MQKTVAIVNYNTPELAAAAIQSVRKHTPGCSFVVFDNSDRRPFVPMDGVTVLDNTKGQLVNFDEMLARYPNKIPTACNWGSEKHIASVDYLFDVLPDGFLLMDSDVLVKQDVGRFFDESVAWVGGIEYEPKFWFQAVRLYPFILWINVPMCRENGIRFFHEGMVYKMSHHGAPYYDTGGSFYEDCASLPHAEVDINHYVEHLGGGSYGRLPWRVWLDEHKDLFEMEEKKKTRTVAKKKVLVVIPFCSQGAQGRELEYAVAGWRRHFKEDYLIVVVGENHPVTETGDDIVYIASERVPEKEGNYRPHLDYVSCFKKVHAAYPKSDGFIFVADDCYAVNDFDLTDVKVLKQIAPDFDGDATSPNGWRRDQAKTKKALVEAGLPSRNFTTHLPMWFDWDKIEALWEKYDMENNSYTIENLYYNTYFPTRIPLQLDMRFDNYKCGIYRENPNFDRIKAAFDGQIWITNSPVGWSERLSKMLAEYYKI